jgi:hypothetical protein
MSDLKATTVPELIMGFTTAVATCGPLFLHSKSHKMLDCNRDAEEWIANGRQEANGFITAP